MDKLACVISNYIETLYKSEYKKLYTLAYRIVKDPETAKDLIHDAFCLATFHQAKLINHPSPEGWLANVVKNLALNDIRRAENRLTMPLQEALSSVAPNSETSLSELLPQKLPAPDQQILLWKFEEQIPYHEIALRLNISETGARSRVARAVARCRLHMNNTDFLD